MCRELRGVEFYGELFDPDEHGYLGSLSLPPAGVEGRTVPDVLRAAWTWGHLEVLGLATGVCPRCSALLDDSVAVCEAHDPDGLCEQCDYRHAVQYRVECTNCIFDE